MNHRQRNEAQARELSRIVQERLTAGDGEPEVYLQAIWNTLEGINESLAILAQNSTDQGAN